MGPIAGRPAGTMALYFHVYFTAQSEPGRSAVTEQRPPAAQQRPGD
jgi:hypothetical protein